MTNLSEIQFELTNDPFLLQDYYSLREESYRDVLGLKNFSGSSDIHDKKGYIVIGRVGKKVISGVRLNIVDGSKANFLPLESDNFKLTNIFPELNLQRKVYSEISRMAISKEFREDYLFINTKMLSILRNIGIKNNCSYQFSCTTKVMSRYNKIMARKQGMEHMAFNNIKLPHNNIFENLNDKMIISITYVKKSLLNKHLKSIKNMENYNVV